MTRASIADQPCPVARSLDVIGEWWTLLIVRDAVRGARRFDEFKGTGIADNILAARLKRLVEEGIFERRPYQEHPTRYEYILTEKGRGLGLVLTALRTWGQRWTRGKDLSRLSHGSSDHNVTARMFCEDCGRALTPDEIRPSRQAARGSSWRAVRSTSTRRSAE